MAEVCRCEENVKKLQAHKGCVIPKACKWRKEIMDYWQDQEPKFKYAAAMVRIGSAIHQIGKSPSAPKDWWTESIAPGFEAETKKWRERQSYLRKELDSRVHPYLDFVKKEVFPDLRRWHPKEFDKWEKLAAITKDVFYLPSPKVYEWFDREVYPAFLSGATCDLSKIYTFGNIKTGFYDLYINVIVHFAPQWVYKAERIGIEAFRALQNALTRAPRYGGVDDSGKASDHYKGKKATGAVPEDKPLFRLPKGESEISLGSMKVRLDQIVPEKGTGNIQIAGSLPDHTGNIPHYRIDATKAVYSMPALAALLSTVAIVLTVRDWTKNTAMKNLLDTSAGASGLLSGLSHIMVARSLCFSGDRVVMSPKWVWAGAKLNFMAGILGGLSAARDALEYHGAGDNNAAALSWVGVAGAILLMVPVWWVALAGIILTIGGAIGVAYAADEDLVKWAKKSPYGTADGKFSPEQSERGLEEVMKNIRLRRADQLEEEARQLRRSADQIMMRKSVDGGPAGSSVDGGPAGSSDYEDAKKKNANLIRQANMKVIEARFLRNGTPGQFLRQ